MGVRRVCRFLCSGEVVLEVLIAVYMSFEILTREVFCSHTFGIPRCAEEYAFPYKKSLLWSTFERFFFCLNLV